MFLIEQGLYCSFSLVEWIDEDKDNQAVHWVLLLLEESDVGSNEEEMAFVETQSLCRANEYSPEFAFGEQKRAAPDRREAAEFQRQNE